MKIGTHKGKRFDQVPIEWREWAVNTVKERNCGNSLKEVKRVCEEYEAWRATQGDKLSPAALSVMNHHPKAALNNKSIPQSRNTKKHPVKNPIVINKDNSLRTRRPTAAGPSRPLAEAGPSTAGQLAEGKKRQLTPRLKQTCLPFKRTPLGALPANIETKQEKTPLKAFRARTRKSPQRKPCSIEAMTLANGNKLENLLSVSKSDGGPNKSCTKGFSTPEKPSCGSSPDTTTRTEAGALTMPEARSPTPRPAKRRKTKHPKPEPEPVVEETISSQSSVPSPWRPLVPLVLDERE
ncbi:hypothetical protein EG329_001010 [Mollisiaceae sp. DMI_Dod_QoI]|nr:hypothetical protein EG329_001010 [Helotiales sp. DMI_Dod_QoI]